MTTGCTCGTAGCGGIAPEPGGQCPDCHTGAMPAGPARTVTQIIHTALYGSDISAGDVIGRHQAGKEAGA
jgi:hypothetical protein